MREVLISLKPYYYYLIGEGIKKKEVRKTCPKANDWNNNAWFYMSKDEKSFLKIPKEHQEKYRKHFGKVGLKFTCDKIDKVDLDYEFFGKNIEYDFDNKEVSETCLTRKEFRYYGQGASLYGWHISNLKIYDKPRELSEFKTPTDCESEIAKAMLCNPCCLCDDFCSKKPKKITRPPQGWCYVEEL